MAHPSFLLMKKREQIWINRIIPIWWGKIITWRKLLHLNSLSSKKLASKNNRWWSTEYVKRLWVLKARSKNKWCKMKATFFKRLKNFGFIFHLRSGSGFADLQYLFGLMLTMIFSLGLCFYGWCTVLYLRALVDLFKFQSLFTSQFSC